MDILYISGMCSENKFDVYFQAGIIKKLPQSQKYHHLLIEGLRENTRGRVLAISSYPVKRSWAKKIFFWAQTESIHEITYRYPFFFNMPILRQICLGVSSFIYSIMFLRNKNKNSVAICDILTKSNSTGARLACRLLKKPCVGIVTDVPGHTSGARRKTLPKYQQYIFNLIERISSKNVDKYDAYLFLTEAMNKVVNPKNKPHIVIEGHSDIKMRQKVNLLENKNDKITVLYSGGIHKEFGIEVLVKAFMKANNDDWELHIYGDGNYKDELEILSAKNASIRYFGVVENAKVVEAQMKAHLLVNPRLTGPEYIKYSFPSKNMEYMASGTPMLTTRLPGMPLEYYDYVYIVDDESVEGFCSALTSVLSQSKSTLHEKGKKANKFVLENKNNVTQSSRLIRFIECVFGQYYK